MGRTIGEDVEVGPQGSTEEAHVPEVESGFIQPLDAQLCADPAQACPRVVEVPTVELVVASTEPGLQGDRSSAGTKPATLETGAEIQVPLFINTGDKLKVDSRDGNYLGRVNA